MALNISSGSLRTLRVQELTPRTSITTLRRLRRALSTVGAAGGLGKNSTSASASTTGVPTHAAKQHGPNYSAVTRNLALELVRVTEAAALSSARWLGRGDKYSADDAAVEARVTHVTSEIT